MNNLASYVDVSLSLEKLRVAEQVRQTHLEKRGRKDTNTDKIVERLVELEDEVNGIIAENLESHPAYWWFSKVKGIGKENIGKVVGFIRVKPEKGVDKEGIEYDLPYADTISALWKFAGFSVVDGHSPKRVKGEKLEYCSQLRSMVWRVGNSLLRARGSFYEYYLSQKKRYEQRFSNQGYQIVPAAKLPTEKGRKVETKNIISEGHIHAMALRKMMKMFLSLLFLAWIKGEGMPETKPYVGEVLKHEDIFNPKDFMDKE